MYLSEDYFVFHIHQQGEQRLLRELELRRVIAERAAERASELAAARETEPVDPAQGVTDAARPRRGIRALLPRRLGPVTPPRPAHGHGTLRLRPREMIPARGRPPTGVAAPSPRPGPGAHGGRRERTAPARQRQCSPRCGSAATLLQSAPCRGKTHYSAKARSSPPSSAG